MRCMIIEIWQLHTTASTKTWQIIRRSYNESRIHLFANAFRVQPFCVAEFITWKYSCFEWVCLAIIKKVPFCSSKKRTEFSNKKTGSYLVDTIYFFRKNFFNFQHKTIPIFCEETKKKTREKWTRFHTKSAGNREKEFPCSSLHA